MWVRFDTLYEFVCGGGCGNFDCWFLSVLFYTYIFPVFLTLSIEKIKKLNRFFFVSYEYWIYNNNGVKCEKYQIKQTHTSRYIIIKQTNDYIHLFYKMKKFFLTYYLFMQKNQIKLCFVHRVLCGYKFTIICTHRTQFNIMGFDVKLSSLLCTKIK